MSAIRKFFHELQDGAALALKGLSSYYRYPKLTLFLVLHFCVTFVIPCAMYALWSYYSGESIRLLSDLMSTYGIGTWLLLVLGLYISTFLTVIAQIWFVYLLIAYFQGRQASFLTSLRQVFEKISTLMVYAAVPTLLGLVPSYSYTVSHSDVTFMQQIFIGTLLLVGLLMLIMVYVPFFFIYPIIACEQGHYNWLQFCAG